MSLELMRLIQGLCKRGVVHEIVKDRAIVNIGSKDNPNLTPPIQWVVQAAGTINCQRVPSVGEQVILLNTGGGDCLSDMVIAGYLHSAKFPAPNLEQDKHTVDAGGYVSHFNTKGDKVTDSKTTTENMETLNINSKTINVTADQTNVTSMVKVKGDSQFIGNVSVTQSLNVAGAGRSKSSFGGSLDILGDVDCKAGLKASNIDMVKHKHKTPHGESGVPQ